MSDRIKAIPTAYNGIQFRSRLEARTARLLDQLKVKWVYEAEGYDLNGTWYLPDFWLPEHRAFVEVKGIVDDSTKKTIKLAKAVPSDIRVFMVVPEHINEWERGSEYKFFRLSRDGSPSESELAMCDICERSVLVPYRKRHCFGVYLAGKVRGDGDWRYQVFPGLSRLSASDAIVVQWENRKPYVPSPPFGREHYYCGPYFSSDHEERQDHKAGLGHYTKHDADISRREDVFRMSTDAIDRADFVFAWLDDLTCYGTLVEIGYARAMGKPIYIGTPERVSGEIHEHLWFALEAGRAVCGDTPLAAFCRAVEIERGE